MKYFNLIYDKNQIELFQNNILKNLNENESYMIFLLARKKYGANIKQECVLDYRIIKNKEDLYKNILKFNLPIECFYDDNNNYFKNKHLAIYITFNPRSNINALKNLMHNSIDLIYNKENISINKLIKSNLQTSISRKVYLDLDFDIPKKELALEYYNKEIKNYFKNSILIETKNGFHCLFETNNNNILNKNWYKHLHIINDKLLHINYKYKIEINSKSQDLIPIPGTLQGGFKVKFF